jgi:hypothetical protein
LELEHPAIKCRPGIFRLAPDDLVLAEKLDKPTHLRNIPRGQFLRAANPRAPTAMASEPLYYCIMDICDCEFAQLQPSHEVSRRPLIATRCLSRIPQVSLSGFFCFFGLRIDGLHRLG